MIQAIERTYKTVPIAKTPNLSTKRIVLIIPEQKQQLLVISQFGLAKINAIMSYKKFPYIFFFK